MSRPTLTLTFVASVALWMSTSAGHAQTDITRRNDLEVHDIQMNRTTYKGRPAVHLTTTAESDARKSATNPGSGGGIAIVPGTEMVNGIIELDLASMPRAGSFEDGRGFAGVAWHVNPEATKQEHLYLRPTNGRAEDQIRRNHSVQYASTPDWEWNRLRKEFPGVYETYVDLVPGEWTHLKLEINGPKLRVYVNNATQPTLIVNDAKMPNATGRVALWIGSGAESYFSNLKVRPSREIR